MASREHSGSAPPHGPGKRARRRHGSYVALLFGLAVLLSCGGWCGVLGFGDGQLRWLAATPVALFCLLVIYAFLDIRRRQHRIEGGHCTNCGYDLRESPGRCPECGQAADGGSGR